MEKIIGITPSMPLKLKKQGDLLFHEGPLLAHFVDENDAKSHYLYKWADCDERANRWLVAAVPENVLLDYLNKSINLLSLLRYSTKLYVSDLDDSLLEVALLECSFENIPASYLPSNRSYFDETTCEPYALGLKANILAGRELDYSLVTEWLDINQVTQSSELSEGLTTLSHEIFDTLLSGYSKKKVFDFFSKESSLQPITLPFGQEYIHAVDASHVGKHFVILVQLKHHTSHAKLASLDFLRKNTGGNDYLRALDAVLLHRISNKQEEVTPSRDMTALLRSYVYDQYQSALEEQDTMIGNLG